MAGPHDTHAAPPDEPKTPMWLPALGAALFLGAGIWWATRPAPPAPAPAEAPSASAAASAAADAGAPVAVPVPPH